jgi:hypothetical protein
LFARLNSLGSFARLPGQSEGSSRNPAAEHEAGVEEADAAESGLAKELLVVLGARIGELILLQGGPLR